MVDCNICGPNAVRKFPYVTIWAFSITRKILDFGKFCTLLGNQLCGERHSGGLCKIFVIALSLCCSHLHTGLTGNPARKGTV